jgi:hypothetical protein
LTATLLQTTPGATSIFLDDLNARAKAKKLSTTQGLLGRLSDIVRGVHEYEEAATQAQQPPGLVRRTKR